VTQPLASVLGGLLLGLLVGCGKYGPPVRAGEEKQPESEPRIEIPLPSAAEEGAPAPGAGAPAAQPPPPLEAEPPPEGAP
jgi:hypothetical protein